MQISILEVRPVRDMYQNTGAPTYTELRFNPATGEVQVRQEHSTNSFLMSVYLDRMRTCRLEGHPHEDDVRAVIEDNADLLDRVAAGFETVWNGSNMVGRYTRDADAAWKKFCAILEACQPYYEYWSARDYCAEVMREFITATTTDAELGEYARLWTQTDPYIVLDETAWLLDHLTQYRDELREEQEEA